MPAYKTIDQEFEDSYAQQGLQPSVGVSTPIRNVKVERKGERNSNKSDRQNNTRQAANDKNFHTSQAAKANNFKTEQKNISSQAGTRVSSQSHLARFTRQGSGLSRSQVGTQDASQTVLSGATSVSSKLKATAITQSIFAWGGLLWLVQLFFAIVSLVMLGAVSAFEELTKEGTMLSLLVKFGEGLAAGIAKVFGVNLNLMEMASDLFMVSSGAVLVIGLITLLGIFFQYTLSGLESFSGKNAGMKIGLFLFAIVGYFTPFLNLLPCALPWVIAVWKYPK